MQLLGRKHRCPPFSKSAAMSTQMGHNGLKASSWGVGHFGVKNGEVEGKVNKLSSSATSYPLNSQKCSSSFWWPVWFQKRSQKWWTFFKFSLTIERSTLQFAATPRSWSIFCSREKWQRWDRRKPHKIINLYFFPATAFVKRRKGHNSAHNSAHTSYHL